MKKFTIKEDTYGVDLEIITDCTLEELGAYLQRILPDSHLPENFFDSRCRAKFTYDVETNYRSIWFPQFTGSLEAAGFINHEILHYVFYVLRSVGIPLCFETEEAYTYLYQSTFNKLWSKLHPALKSSGGSAKPTKKKSRGKTRQPRRKK